MKQTWKRYARQPEVAVTALSLLVRLWFSIGFATSPLFTPVEGGHDRTLYHQAAQSVASGAIWPDGSFAHLPLYPWVLGAVYAITGPDLRAAAALGLLCDTLTVFLLMRLARRLGANSGWTLLAGLLYALYPRAILYAAVTMPTSLNVLLVTALALGLAPNRAAREAATPAGNAATGLLAGVAGLGYPALWPGLLLIAATRAIGRGKSFAFLALALLPLLPVVIHNTRAEGHLTLLSTHGGFNFYMGNFERATGYPLRVRDFRMSAAALLEDAHRAAEREVGHPLARSESSAWWAAEARRFIREQPAQAARLLLRKLRLFWSGTEVDDLRLVEQVRLVDGRFTAPLWPCFALFSAAGLFGLLRAGPAPALRLLLTGSIFSIATVFITTRYRLPLTPALAAFGAAGLTILARDLRTRSRLRGHALALLVALGLAAWPGGVRDVRATDHYNASVQLLAAGQAEAALTLAQKGLSLATPPAELHHAEGSALFRLGRFREAADAFTRALARQPGYASARFNLALSLGRAGDPCAAVTVLEADPNPEPRAAALLPPLRALCQQNPKLL
jgi:hypothetical protein